MKRRDARPRVKVLDVHRYLWALVDGRQRVQIPIVTLATDFEVHRDIIADALLEMRATGRIKMVECRRDKAYVYRVTDPDTYVPGDDRTNLTRPRLPAWG